MNIVMCTEPMSPAERLARDHERTAERLDNLSRSLVIAGALTKSFRLGDLFGWDMAAEECMCGWHRDDDEAPVRPEAWRPNAKGMRAP